MMGTIGLVMERGVERVWRYLRPHGLIKGSVVCFCCPAQPLKNLKKKKKIWNIFQFLFSLIQKDTNPKCCKQTEQNRTKIEIKWRITLKKKKKPRMACDVIFLEKWIWYAVAFVLFYFILNFFFFLDFQIYYFILFFLGGWGEEAIISKCPLRLGKKNQNVACDVFIHNVFIRAEIIEREKKKNGEGGIG